MKRLILIFLLLVSSCFATYSEFYVQTTGSNLNAGSTTSDTALVTYTSGSWVQATCVFTPASGNPVTDGVTVGMFASAYIDGSTVTGWVGRITAVSSTTVTCSITATTGTAPANQTLTCSLKVGGAWAGPNGSSVNVPFSLVRGNLTNSAGNHVRVNFKNGTSYAVTASVFASNSGSGAVIWEGYTTTPGDGGQAVLDGGTSVAGYNLFTISTSSTIIRNFIFDHNGNTSNFTLVTCSVNDTKFDRCIFRNSRGIGLTISNGPRVRIINCEAYGNATNGSANPGFNVTSDGATFINCASYDNGTNGPGFNGSNAFYIAIHCLAFDNGGDGFSFSGSTSGAVFINCDSYSNTIDGFDTGALYATLINCNSIANGGYGLNAGTSGVGILYNCGFGSGTMANTLGANTFSSFHNWTISGTITYAANVTPWVDPDTTNNFTINLAAAKGTGYGVFPAGIIGTGYPDVGAVQHQDSGGAAVEVSSGYVK